MLKLEFPNETHKEMYEEMRKEWSKEPDFADTSPWALFHWDTFDEFLEITKKYQEWTQWPIRAILFFLVNKNIILWGIQVRHSIEHPNLKEHWWHIWYGIRPSERKKWYASEMLKLWLLEAKKLWIDKVLISCYDWNIGSEKVILKNWGVFERQTLKEGKKLNRYWITL